MVVYLIRRWNTVSAAKAVIFASVVPLMTAASLWVSMSEPMRAYEILLSKSPNRPDLAFSCAAGLAATLLLVGMAITLLLLWEILPQGELMALYDLGKDLALYWMGAFVIFYGSAFLVFLCERSPKVISLDFILAVVSIDLTLGLYFPITMIGKDMAYLAELRELNKRKKDQNVVTVVAGHIYVRDFLFGIALFATVLWQVVRLYEIGYRR